MPSARRRPRPLCALPLALAGLVLGWLSLAAQTPVPPPAATAEIRALWVLRTTLTTPERIAALVQTARRDGFNTLLVQVRGRGDAYFNDSLEPRAAELAARPDFDPLATVLERAHAAGLRVHAWTNLNLVSSAVTLPTDQAHIVRRHPEWLMLPRALAQPLARVAPASPAYATRLAQWSRGQAATVEGLYASPLVPAAADHAQAVVRDLTRRYALDGVHFDYARFPGPAFDYSPAALAEFRNTVRPTLPAAERQRLDARQRQSVLAYPDALPEQWRSFRMERMTALMRRLRAVVKAERPAAIVSVAVKPELRDAREARLQDWAAWLQDGIVDVVCPMAYTAEAAAFATQIAAAQAAAGDGQVWAGIGAYRLPVGRTVENIRTARRLGAAGIILFSYDSLADPRVTSPGYLRDVGRAAFDVRAAAGTP